MHGGGAYGSTTMRNDARRSHAVSNVRHKDRSVVVDPATPTTFRLSELSNSDRTAAMSCEEDKRGLPVVQRPSGRDTSEKSATIIFMIEWTRLSGEQVEELVAVLINLEYEKSTRITPSRGDGGVDIISPDRNSGNRFEIYQVKKFSSTLNPNQKRQIESSLKSLMNDERWKVINITNWNLVTPYNPTPELYNWFNGLTKTYEFKAHWLGLDFIEGLACKYPEVCDYFINNRSDEFQQRTEKFLAMFGLGFPETYSNLQQMLPRLRSAVGALQEDPFYKFNIRMEYTHPSVSMTDEAVISKIIAPNSQNDPYVIVDVIPKCAESENLSPIGLELKMEVNQERLDALNRFAEYGAPVSSLPVEKGLLQAPNGIGGKLQRGIVSLEQDFPDIPDHQKQLRIDVIGDHNNSLAYLDIDRIDLTYGDKGARTVLSDPFRVLTIEICTPYDEIDKRIISWKDLDVKNKPLAQVEPVIRFLSFCMGSNIIRIGWRNSWKASVQESSSLTELFNNSDFRAMTKGVETWGSTLYTIQEHTATVINSPSPQDVSEDDFERWYCAARILQGEKVVAQYPDKIYEQFIKVPNGAKVRDGIFFKAPFGVQVGATMVDLGQVNIVFDNPTLQLKLVDGEYSFYQFSTEDRIFSYSLNPPNGDYLPIDEIYSDLTG